MIRFVAKLNAAALLFPFVFVGVFVGLAIGTAQAADEGKCTIAIKGDSPTAQACAKGGRAAAKKLMKDWVKQAKGNGQKYTCDGCHKDLDSYELTKNAVDDYKKLEAAAKPK
jgi:hypothetical protein